MDIFPVSHNRLPKDGVTIEAKRRTNVAQFGDGYFQAADDGINVDMSAISITWENQPKNFGDLVYNFLFARLNHTPFLFTVPATSQEIIVVCKSVERKVLNEYIYASLTCRLERTAYLGSLT